MSSAGADSEGAGGAGPMPEARAERGRCPRLGQSGVDARGSDVEGLGNVTRQRKSEMKRGFWRSLNLPGLEKTGYARAIGEAPPV